LDALTNEAENGTKAGEDDDEDEDKEGQGSGAEEEDYDDEEDLIDENDYGQNYFDNGEGDDIDDDDGMWPFNVMYMLMTLHIDFFLQRAVATFFKDYIHTTSFISFLSHFTFSKEQQAFPIASILANHYCFSFCLFQTLPFFLSH
jgi:hypothetical protein